MLISKHISLRFTATLLLFVSSSFSIPGQHDLPKKITQTVDCPTFDYTSMVVTDADCQEANGSITGIKIISTGTKTNYTWYNSAKTIVGHTADLKNIPAGLYYLMISDNSDCVNNITSKKILVANENAISMDESGASTIDASCGNGGAISGISVIGATEYDWYNIATKTIVSASIISPDLLNVQPGEYQLNAHNSTCQSISRIYTISSEVKVPKVIDYSTVDPICPVDNGSISVTLSIQSQQPKLKFYFTDSTGSHLFDGVITGDNPNPVLTATGLYGGIFYLYVQDDNNCSVLLGTYTLTEANVYISQTETEVVNDRCNQHLGYIAPVIKGYKESKGDQYTWTDVNTGQVVGKNKILSKVGAGTYQLKIITVAGCRGKAVFTLNNISPALVPPIAEGTTSCLPSLINITVTNVDTSKLFRLYDSPTSTVPIDSSKTGIFYKQVDQTTDYYVTRVSKDCESDRTKVTETVVVSIKIPNAFTPNGDGVNDTWVINGIDKFPGADLKIFTRYGKLIYHSINYPVPFDGTHNGAPLPAGAYYYILDVKQPICYGKISGSITIIR